MTDCRRLWPPSDTGAQLLHWGTLAGKLLRKHDAIGSDGLLDRPLLIAIRGAAPGDERTHEMHARPAYDDAFVLVSSNAEPMVVRGATHSYQVDSRLSPDENGDKRGDVGSIRPGHYVLNDTRSEPYPIFLVTMPDGSVMIPCWRDISHDGRISEAERVTAETARKGKQVNAAGFYATAVLLHTGWDAPDDSPHRSSISCLTMNHRHLEAVRSAAGSGGKLDCVLVDAAEIVAMVPAVENVA